MQGTLFDGAEMKPDLSQWYTDPRLAKRMMEWTLLAHPNVRTLVEPSAGEGSLIKPWLDYTKVGVFAVELDPANVVKLEGLGPRVHVVGGDVLNVDVPMVDAAVMNPPYEDDQDALHVMRALEVAPFVTALLRGVIKHGVNRWKKMWQWVDVVREVNLIERPTFGGSYTPKQDFVVLELVKRERRRERGEPAPVASIEWW